MTLLLTSATLCFSHDTPGAESLRIDHVIVGASDLDRALVRFEQLTGVRPVSGGDNPGRASRNALVSLGKGRYLELIAPRTNSSPSPEVVALRNLKDLTPLRWAVSTKVPEATARNLRQLGYAVSDPLPGSRVKPDGTTVSWVRFRITEPKLEQAPFLINWDYSSLHPSVDSPAGCDLTKLALVLSNPEPYRGLLQVLAVGVEARQGGTPRLEVTLTCPKGIVRLGMK